MDKIKEMVKNKKVLTGAAAGLAVLVILIIIIAVSCSKNNDTEKDTTKSNDSTTVAKLEKDTDKDINEEYTTELDTELSENKTTEGGTEVAEIDTTEPPTTVKVENVTTNVNIQEPVTEEPTTEEVTIKITAEVPSTPSQEIQTPKPTEASTEKTTECAVLPGCENRESSNIIYIDKSILLNKYASDGADVCPFKLYDLNNLVTYKYTNGNGYYVTFVGYYGLHCYSDYDGSILELEYNYATDVVKSYGYGSLEKFEAEAEKLKTNTAATSSILVGSYMNIPSTIDAEEEKEAEFWASLGQEYDYEILGGEIEFYGLYMVEY